MPTALGGHVCAPMPTQSRGHGTPTCTCANARRYICTGTSAAKTFLDPSAASTPNADAISHGHATRLRLARAAHHNAASAYGIATPSESVRLVQISLRYGFQNAS